MKSPWKASSITPERIPTRSFCSSPCCPAHVPPASSIPPLQPLASLTITCSGPDAWSESNWSSQRRIDSRGNITTRLSGFWSASTHSKLIFAPKKVAINPDWWWDTQFHTILNVDMSILDRLCLDKVEVHAMVLRIVECVPPRIVYNYFIYIYSVMTRNKEVDPHAFLMRTDVY
jgi:hypothetical protein